MRCVILIWYCNIINGWKTDDSHTWLINWVLSIITSHHCRRLFAYTMAVSEKKFNHLSLLWWIIYFTGYKQWFNKDEQSWWTWIDCIPLLASCRSNYTTNRYSSWIVWCNIPTTIPITLANTIKMVVTTATSLWFNGYKTGCLKTINIFYSITWYTLFNSDSKCIERVGKVLIFPSVIYDIVQWCWSKVVSIASL